VRAGAVEFLFAGTGPAVAEEARRQLRRVFGGNGPPSRLITVHIRWGDKKAEMKLRPIREYVDAVERLSQGREEEGGGGSSVGVFLATEDPRAAREFQREAAARNWTVYLDWYYQEFHDARLEGYENHVRLAEQLGGRPGLVALASLLVALQADDYVLTTKSNWSRLINELRKNVLDPRCGNCTRLVNLARGEW
jgi:hypothetical protein